MQRPAPLLKLLCLLYVYCLILCSCYTTWAQVSTTDTITLPSERLSVADGLSQGLISSIVQDRDGIMWFGTKDGLNKYDGYRFTVYRHEQGNLYSLPGNYVNHIAEDDNGNLWIGTYFNGLYLFDRAAEKFYPVKLSKNSAGNQGIYEMQYANARLIVQTNQLASYDVSHIYPSNYNNIDLSGTAIVFNRTKYIAPHRWSDYSLGLEGQVMHDGSLWFSYPDSVFVFAIKSKEYVPVKSFSTALLGNDVKKGYRFYPLPQHNRLLCINDKYLVVYDTTANTIVKRYSLFIEKWDPERAAIKTPGGNYFISGGSTALNYIFNSVTNQLKPEKGQNSVKLLLDRNDILWLGTAGNGIVKHDIRKQLFTTVKDYLYAAPHNTNGDIVMMVNKLPHLVNLYTKSSNLIFPPNVWNPTWEYINYVMDRQGIHYLKYSINDSLNLISYNPATGTVKKQDWQFLGNTNGEYLLTDNKDNFWIQVEDATNRPLLIRIDKNTLQKQVVYKFPVYNDVITGGSFITSYWQDAADVFWFATVKGLFSFDEMKKKWNHYQHNPANLASLSTDILFSICPDPQQPVKYLWLGTDGMGITRFEIATGNCIHFTDKDGLPNGVVYGILSDKAGNLWLSTNKGLCVINPSADNNKQNSPLDIKGLFTSDDGLPGNEFNRYEYYKLPNGDLFFGGTEGGVVFNAEKVLTKEAPPSIVLTGLSVYNKPVSHITDSAIISQNIMYAKSITLPYNKNMFSISFAALEYRASSKKKYKYYLENYDDTWIDAGSKNEATYTNLPPGSYTFHVKGKGSMSDWTIKDATIRVIILPAWYQTWWFKLAVALSFAGGLYILYRYRLKQQLKLLNLRNHIAADLHDEIGSTLSSISLSSSVIQSKINGSSPEVNTLLNQISNNTNNMMEAMSDIVWAINTKNDRFDNVINRMRAFAIEILEPKDCLVHFNAPEELNNLTLDMAQRKNLYLIFKEAINNAAKYSQSQNVWIDMRVNRNNKFVLKIKDDGVGFETATIGSSVKSGELFGGNGLASMQKRAHEIEGTVIIHSEVSGGTEVMVEFII